MYDLPYHKENNAEIIKDFIAKHPFAFLSGVNDANQPVATQVPLFFEERGTKTYLSGHIMRNTDHHKAFMQNDQVLAVFSGNHTYVSGTWYSNPHTPSTWNYMSVHARGSIHFLGGAALQNMLRKISLHFENNNPDSPTAYDNLDPEKMESIMKAIVAFEIEVTALDNVFKLSQDRDEQSYHNIIKKLRERGDADSQAIADEMEQRADLLFKH
ncbi:MAG: FMN-binding negative transcriptional regulator [Cyclobacteriaceae bacterium]